MLAISPIVLLQKNQYGIDNQKNLNHITVISISEGFGLHLRNLGGPGISTLIRSIDRFEENPSNQKPEMKEVEYR